MEWQSIRWSIPLESPPVIVQIGKNTHGRESEEHFVLPDLWCLHLYEYEAEVEADSQRLPIRPGYAGITPPGVPMLYHFLGRSPHYYAHFSMAMSEPTYRIPAMLDLMDNFQPTVAGFVEAVGFWSINRTRSSVRLWDLLWQLTDLSETDATQQDTPPAIRRALAYIDSHLHEPLSIRQLAEQQNISHNHFTRLFGAVNGCTPMDYIQRRRVEQAKHLLLYSKLPIKSIAASIGITDPQIFNKFVRHYLNKSPRMLREEGLTKVGLLE